MIDFKITVGQLLVAISMLGSTGYGLVKMTAAFDDLHTQVVELQSEVKALDARLNFLYSQWENRRQIR